MFTLGKRCYIVPLTHFNFKKMKNYAIVFILYLCFNPHLQAQRFNNFYTEGLGCTNIKVNNGGYIGTFFTNLHGIEHYLTRIDSDGTLISNIQIPITSITGLGARYSSLSKLQNGKFILAAISDRGLDNSGYADLTGELYGIDENFSTILWHQSQQYHNDSLTRYLKCKWLPNSDIIVAGEASFYNPAIHAGNSRIVLVRTDSLGNKRWEKDFVQQAGYNMYFDGLAATPDGGFVLGCTSLLFTGDDATDGLTAQCVLIKVDSLGNEQWRKVWGKPNIYDGHTAVHTLLDGTILTINEKGLIPHNPMLYISYTPWSTLEFRRWSVGGVLLQSKQMVQEYGEACEYADMLVRPNGNYAIVHRKYDEPQGKRVYGYFEFTPALDSVRSRYYPNTFNPNAHKDESIIGSIDNTPDGGVVCAGSHYCSGDCPVNPGAQAWIMKLDSAGCEIDNCWVGTVSEQSAVNSEPLRVFPNPTTGIVTIALLPTISHATAQVYDALGRIVHTTTLGNTTTELDLRALPTGLYIVRVYDGEVCVGVQKLQLIQP